MSPLVQTNVSLKNKTTLQVGGVARYYCTLNTKADLWEAVSFLKEHQELPFVVLGAGSNLLVDDSGYPGLVLAVELKGGVYQEGGGGLVLGTAAAGEIWDELVAATVARGLWGLENLSAIPGTVGATPIQNVGAYGVEVADSLVSLKATNLRTGQERVFTNEECDLRYRDSWFKTEAGREYVITEVTFSLRKTAEAKVGYADLAARFSAPPDDPQAVREAVIAIRAGKFPDWQVVGTAGSFFKNPVVERQKGEALLALYPNLPLYQVGNDLVKIPLGYVLDKICGLKGYRTGNVGLYEAQALVLVNYGGASANEIHDFVKLVKQKVYEKTEIEIEPEVRFVP